MNNKYKEWLQEYVARYGIDLSGYVVSLEHSNNHPRMIGGYLPSRDSLYAYNPNDDTVEITVDDIWVDDDGKIIQFGRVVLG